jgi:hypothetical protein
MLTKTWMVLLGWFLLGFVGGVIPKIFHSSVSFAQTTRSFVTAQEMRLLDVGGKTTGRWIGDNTGGKWIVYV